MPLDPIDPIDPIDPPLTTDTIPTTADAACMVAFLGPARSFQGSIVIYQWAITRPDGGLVPAPHNTSTLTFNDSTGTPVPQTGIVPALQLTTNTTVPAAAIVVSVRVLNSVVDICTFRLSLAIWDQILIVEQTVRISP